jgi:hypothetical protein
MKLLEPALHIKQLECWNGVRNLFKAEVYARDIKGIANAWRENK